MRNIGPMGVIVFVASGAAVGYLIGSAPVAADAVVLQTLQLQREGQALEIEVLKHQVDLLQRNARRAAAPTDAPTLLQPDPAFSDEPTASGRGPDTLSWLQRLSSDRFGHLTAGELAHMRALDLSGIRLDSDDLRALAAIDGLVAIDLSRCGLSDDDVALLGGMTALEELDLRGALLTDVGLGHLAGLTNLRQLNLDGTMVTDAGLVELRGLSRLKELRLDGTQITDAGLEHLGHLPLESVSIGRTAVSDQGLSFLSQYDLKELSLYRNENLTDEGLRQLAGQSGLEILMLGGTSFSADGLAALQGMTSLRTLNASLSMNDAGMLHLAGLTDLTQLGLYSNPEITDVGAAYLRDLVALETLQLQFTSITDTTLDLLDGLPSLHTLDLRGTKVTAAAVALFRARHPTCLILF